MSGRQDVQAELPRTTRGAACCDSKGCTLTETAATSRPTDDELERWFDDFSNWGRWGPDDTMGALNLITPEKKRAAAGLVREGHSLTLARVIELRAEAGPR